MAVRMAKPVANDVMKLSQSAYLARRLADMPEGDGSVLDRTLIVWANELGRGDHNLSNVPLVFVGGGLDAVASVRGRARVVDAGFRRSSGSAAPS